MAETPIDGLPKLAKVGLWMAAIPLFAVMVILIAASTDMAFGSGEFSRELAGPALFSLSLFLPGFSLFLIGMYR